MVISYETRRLYGIEPQAVRTQGVVDDSLETMTTVDRLHPNVMKPDEPETIRMSKLYRLGETVAYHRRAVLVTWLLVLALCAILYPSLRQALGAPNYAVRGTESSRVEQLLERRFPGLGSEDDAVVFFSRHHIASQSAYRSVIASVVNVLRRQQGVKRVLGPYDPRSVGQISSDEHAAVAAVALGGDARQRFDRSRRIQNAVAGQAGKGVQVWVTGYSPIARDLADVENIDVERAEAIGVPVALIILLLALGAPLAAMVPLVLAGAGLLLTYGVLAVLATLFHFDSLLLAIVTMIGLGIGIDYSLFVVSRFREELAREEHGGRNESDRVAGAVGTAIATSGRTILFSGVIVALSLASLLVVNSPFFREIAVGAVAVVGCMLVAALTLLPSVLALLGSRINRGALPQRLQPANARPGANYGRGGWANWALTVMRHPIPAASVAGAILILAALPVLGMHYGVNLGVLSVAGTSSGEGQKVLTRSFAPGAISPIQIILTDHRGHLRTRSGVVAGARALTSELERDKRVAGVVEGRAEAGVVLAVVPAVPIDSSVASALVLHIRKDLAPRIHAAGGPTVLVGGATANDVDLSNDMRMKFPVVLALILGLSLLFLVVIFRSIVLPIKAVLMNLLVTGAALGLVVLVFQDGHGEHLLGFTSTGFVQAPLPLLVFALLFGLSMDYEVFLIRRIQEERRRTHDNRLAVAAGIEHTARPITAAAAIMVAVFGSFVTATLLEVKQLGFALAVAIALDATLIRLVLVPAVMRLLGARNWWLPAPLARVLPDVTL
jgi:putative drug exporter of the RND superfamily